MSGSSIPDDDRTVVRRELRRARRYVAALLEGLSDDDMERPPLRPQGTCVKWHLGHLAFVERQILARQVPSLRADVPERDLPFAAHAMHDRSEAYPLGAEIRASLDAARRLVDALLDNVRLDGAALETFREIVDAEYAQARYLRLRRQELGRSSVVEPGGRLVAIDTDCEAPPRFHVPSWEAPSKPPRAGGAIVVSIEDRRHARAEASLERGHELAGRGDVRAALEAFEAAHGLEPSAEALTFQAWMHAQLGDVERAERLCLEAIELDPDFGNPYNDIGTICLRRKDVTAAIQWFERAKRARRYEPRHFPFVNLANLYVKLGLPEKALLELEGALSFQPGDTDIRGAIESLRRQIEESP